MHLHRGRATRREDEKTRQEDEMTRQEDEMTSEEGWAQAVGHEPFEGP